MYFSNYWFICSFCIFVDCRNLIKSLKATNDDLYAFFEPSMIADVGGNSVEKASDYMSRHMLDSQKKIFIAAHNRG